MKTKMTMRGLLEILFYGTITGVVLKFMWALSHEHPTSNEKWGMVVILIYIGIIGTMFFFVMKEDRDKR